MTKETMGKGNILDDYFNNIPLKKYSQLYKELINKYSYNITTKNKQNVLKFNNVIENKNKILNRMKDNIEFEEIVNQIRNKYGFKEIEKTYGEDYYKLYKFSFEYISSYKDETMKCIKEYISKLSGGKLVSLDDYIIVVYYLFFDELITYESFIRILINNDSFSLLGPKEDICEKDVEDLDLLLKEINDEGYHKNRINKFLKFITTIKNQAIINDFRLVMEVEENNSVENHYHNYVRYYKYLKKHDLYKKNEDFINDIFTVMEKFKEFDYRNELDYLWLINYLIFNSELDKDTNKEELTCLIPEVRLGYDLINNNRVELDSCYVKLPIFTTSNYLVESKPMMNSMATDIYGLPTGKERINNSSTKYINQRIYKIYSEYRDKGDSEIDAINKTIEDINEIRPDTIVYKYGENGIGETSEYDQTKRIIKYMTEKYMKKGKA